MANRKPAKTFKDEEVLPAFMDSFHVMCNKPYWPKLREQGNYPKISKVTVTQDKGNLHLSDHSLDPAYLDLAAAFMRKWIVGADGMTFERIRDQIPTENVNPNVIGSMPEHWAKAMDKTYEFSMYEDRTVGVKLVDDHGNARLLTWPGPETKLTHSVGLKLRDFADVYFYHGYLHDKEKRGPKSPRTIVSTTPLWMQDRLAQVVASGALAYSMMLHHAAAIAKPELCPPRCPEIAELEKIRTGASTLPT